ncbi:DUF2789 domain-containing protein [Algicola sagamiensis]|uniref:DUF2789 domain-containing protein n=1 Tax=Algicola sagamiensis TaxID=163869 RepID=UPI00036D2CDF|nr:DUF2789 domain-containing protein [Algicola sagamiensis]
MDTSAHNMTTLFTQLGLPSDDASIDQFIASHSLRKEQAIDEASFWTSSQACFIRESLTEDADWAEIIDQLDTMLRK